MVSDKVEILFAIESFSYLERRLFMLLSNHLSFPNLEEQITLWNSDIEAHNMAQRRK